MSTRQEAETDLIAIIGSPPGEPILNPPTSKDQASARALMGWLHFQDIPALGEHGTEKASLWSIVKAYQSPAYLAGWKRNIAKGSRGRRSYTPADNAGKQSIDSLLDDEDEGKAIDKPIPDSTARAKNVAAGLFDTPPAPMDLKSILHALAPMIANAAEKVLGEKVLDLEGKLPAIARQALADSVDSLKITQKIRDEINGIVTAAALKAIAENLPRRIEIAVGNATPRTLPAEPRHKAFDEILTWLATGAHVYIVGPAGTGKTHLFQQLAAALDKRLVVIGQALTKYDLSGYKSPTGEYISTLMRDAIENGGLVAIDEGDMWAAAALGFLNQPLANSYCAFPDAVVPVHKDFQVILAANTFGRGANQQYQGRNPLDAASLDRFAYVEVDYDEDLERQLHGSGPWVQYVQRVRRAVSDLKLQHVISMRATARCVAGALAGVPAAANAFSNLWRGLTPDTVAKIRNLAGEPPVVSSTAPTPAPNKKPSSVAELLSEAEKKAQAKAEANRQWREDYISVGSA